MTEATTTLTRAGRHLLGTKRRRLRRRHIALAVPVPAHRRRLVDADAAALLPVESNELVATKRLINFVKNCILVGTTSIS